MRHAFLIIAHNNWGILSRLLRRLDHVSNDIYLHIDSKVIFNEDEREVILNSCKYSNIYFVKRLNVSWGGYSLIKCEMRLLQEACKKKYDYYHILSGVDFPIKSMEKIHCFFEENKGFEFIHIGSDSWADHYATRYAQYHLLQEYIGRHTKGILYFFERILLYAQRNILHIDRKKRFDLIFKCGSQWCSITDECARYILSKEMLIKECFKYSCCCDEFFIQTIVYNSYLNAKIYSPNVSEEVMKSNLRCIDWRRGKPYTFTVYDYDELRASGNLFCRKVDDSSREYDELIQKLEAIS